MSKRLPTLRIAGAVLALVGVVAGALAVTSHTGSARAGHASGRVSTVDENAPDKVRETPAMSGPKSAMD